MPEQQCARQDLAADGDEVPDGVDAPSLDELLEGHDADRG